MKRNRNLRVAHLFYASPWLFAAACALLLLIIAVFAVNNYQREKRLMAAILEQGGETILSLVDSSSRAALRRALMSGEVGRKLLIEAIQQIIDNSSEHAGIVSLYLVDEQGVILAHNDQRKIDLSIDKATRELIATMRAEQLPKLSRLTEPAEKSRPLYQIVMPFHPMRRGKTAWLPGREPGVGRGAMMEGRPPALSRERVIREVGGWRYVFVAELSTDEARRSVRTQFLQIVVLSLALFLVGIGGLLSLMTLQGLKGSQTRLKRISAFTDTLIASLPIGIIATGNDGNIKTCNQRAREMLGLDEDHVLGKSFQEILPAQLLEPFMGPHKVAAGNHWEILVDAESATSKSLHCTRVDFKGPERAHSGTMLLVQDLSQLRELEHELQRFERDAAIGRMAAGVAHELRNPLSSIKGLALLLKAKVREAQAGPEAADLLVDEVERLNRSIGELLDYAKEEKLHLSLSDIDEVIRKALRVIRADIEDARIVVEARYRCGHAPVLIDQDKITQVVLNLCLNSIQAMSPGGRLQIITGVEDGDAVVVVRDEGTGIAPPLLERVFEPYVTTKNDGTGLGLALSAKIVKDHNGSLLLKSEPGQGTTATLRVPLPSSARSAPAPVHMDP